MSPEKKIFLRVLTLSILATILLLLNNLYIAKDINLVIFEIIALIFIVSLYFFSRRITNITLVSKIFGVTVLLILNMTWFQSGGFRSSIPYLFILIVLFLLVVFDNIWKKGVVPIIIINILTLFFLEYNYPDKVNNFEYPQVLISHGLILIVVISLAGYILSSYKKYYLRVQSRHEKAISLLKEKNKKIEEQHSLITEQNLQLQKYNKGLEDDVFKNNVELEKKNKELQIKNENLEKFASIIAHDLKLPISQISGLLQIIPSDFTDDFRVEEIIYRIRASASELREITDDLSRVVDVQLTEKVETVNITDILNAELKNLEKYTSENNTEINSEIESDIIANGNPAFYSNIFNNIIHNAIKFSSREDRPEVKVSLISKSGLAYFKVIDNGIGYSGSKSDFGIGMYNKGGETLSGKGYGLYLVKSQLDKIGGHLSINGKDIKGTEVKISIPLKVSD
ncbi:sensor histidine kinase [Mangrovivirga cuniculi]|uniref:histidine kinase n=1 Tax=Mangrovivirga cuniculi TaxID=2715131 RepID=A0A4D7JRZ6_9BACT|nr:HAMP domain-containing sensor histidine kinase [Mangrovivirga cuniculi]QCK14696.1 hypothetical protein DCC35_08050 [Mangrovivirga cuniculi]